MAERASYDVGYRVGVGCAVLGAVMVLGVMVLAQRGLGRAVSVPLVLFGLAIMLAGILAGLRFKDLRVPPELQASMREVRQGQWVVNLVLITGAAVAVSVFAGAQMWNAASGEAAVQWPVLMVAAVFMLIGLIELTLYRWRPLLDEEITRRFAGEAKAWGFAAAVAGMAVSMGLMLVDLRWGVSSLLPVIAGSLWVAGLRLWWLMRRAERG
ncbi:hypothetical protein GCM10009093_09390 [Brevundimonas terrae]|uniref:DUF2178 domain-containing protein n=1 Tax=Brevundimonas terrae TaxID=363631 RepID=A0ABP3I0X5_9CAUL|nr:hypothetical protein [Brevundimonas terrae]NIJ25504.1 putative membrane protein [Brevundimonas terrae]